jgi:hypothetical protein
MNDVTIFIYLVFFVALAAATFAYMFKMMTSTLADFDKRPVRSYGDAMRAYTPHPEAPKNGEQVMTVDFKSCDLDEYNSLQERINEIREKLEEDEDDDDGDILALNR